MNRAGKILLYLASGVACHVFAKAADDALPDNPYALVVTRNVFGLNPTVPVVATTTPTDPPPKITPNGILSIFGHTQVLFKAAVAKPGQAAKDESYNLSEGQSEDDIEVIRIDEKNGIVTFNNHGTTQELPLIAGAASGGEPAAAAGPVNMPGRVPTLGAIGSIGSAGGVANGGNNSRGANNNLTLPSLPTRVNTANQQAAMSPEEQIVALEVNRELTKDQVMRGEMPPLPPTEITPEDATGFRGNPLVTPEPDGGDGTTPTAP
jgi:hypothetical protein